MMRNTTPQTIAVANALDEVIRNDRGRLLSGLISRLGDFQLAEDALQEAAISALGHWGRSGIPHSPIAWLMRVALNKGIDRIRASSREEKKAENQSHVAMKFVEDTDTEEIPDERLRLIFACCNPALDEKSRIALTLRTVCGLTTREIAAVFIDADSTIGQRISRAKTKIKTKGIGFSIPGPELWDTRLDTVLSTVYLIYTTGYVVEELESRDFCEEALFLVQLLNELNPGDPEIEGAFALMLFTQSRKDARIDSDGASVPVAEQNRQRWNHLQKEQADQLLQSALKKNSPGPFQIKAALADCHMAEPTPDWKQMSFLYHSLWHFEPTPVVALNWAVILSELGEEQLALDKIETLGGELAEFQPWYAARAHVLTKLGRFEEARAAYAEAFERSQNAANSNFLNAKLQQYDMR